jgi:hypothetical protein
MANKTSKQAQRSKSALQREARQRKERQRKIRIYLIVGLLVLAVIAAFVVAALADREDVEGVESFGGLGRDHTEDLVEYEQSPPVGGDHSGTPLTCGIYTAPVANQNTVHSLEHGAVWITYQPDLDEQDVTALTAFVLRQDDTTQNHMILSPYEGQPEPIMMSAWGRQLVVDGVDDPRIQEFTDLYVRGRQAPEPGQPCIGVQGPAG